MDGGYHRIEVRTGSRTWSREQQFSAGQPYQFDAFLNEDKAGPGSGLVTIGAEDRRPKPKTRRLAVVLGVGAAIDILGNNFPPHQVALNLGGEYRVIEGTYAALDLALRVPVEFLQSWTNAGFLVGLRGAFTPVPRLPLEIFLAGDLGLGVLEFRSSAPYSSATSTVCTFATSVAGQPCTLYGVRLVPAVGLAYRVQPAVELRLQGGFELNLTGPLLDPRLNAGIAAAYRFY
jgi:hypothetical protein